MLGWENNINTRRQEFTSEILLNCLNEKHGLEWKGWGEGNKIMKRRKETRNFMTNFRMQFRFYVNEFQLESL